MVTLALLVSVASVEYECGDMSSSIFQCIAGCESCNSAITSLYGFSEPPLPTPQPTAIPMSVKVVMTLGNVVEGGLIGSSSTAVQKRQAIRAGFANAAAMAVARVQIVRIGTTQIERAEVSRRRLVSHLDVEFSIELTTLTEGAANDTVAAIKAVPVTIFQLEMQKAGSAIGVDLSTLTIATTPTVTAPDASRYSTVPLSEEKEVDHRMVVVGVVIGAIVAMLCLALLWQWMVRGPKPSKGTVVPNHRKATLQMDGMSDAEHKLELGLDL